MYFRILVFVVSFLTYSGFIHGQEFNAIWAHQIGGLSEDQCKSIQHDELGNIYVQCEFRATIVIGDIQITSNGDLDILILK